MSFLKESAGVLSARIISICLTIVTGIITTRYLGPTGKGMLVLISNIPALIVAFGNLGIGNANLYFLGQKKHPIEKIVSNSATVSIFLGLFLYLLGIIFFTVFKESLFQDIPFFYAYICFSTIPFLLFQKYSQYTFLGKDLIAVRNKLYVFPRIVKLFMVIVFIVILGYRVLGVLILDVITYGIGLLFTYYLLRRITSIRLSYDNKLVIESIKFGIIPFIALLIINLNFKADIYMVKYYLDSKQVGLYSLGVSVAEMLWLVPEAISLVLFAKVSNIDKGRDKYFASKVCRFALNVSTAGTVILFIIADWLIPLLYGKDFVPSVMPLKILLPGIVMMNLYLILHADLTARGKAMVTLKVFLLALVINILMNIKMIPAYGINGAALASAISYSLGALLLAYVYSKITGTTFVSLFIMKKDDYTEYIYPKIKTLFSNNK